MIKGFINVCRGLFYGLCALFLMWSVMIIYFGGFNFIVSALVPFSFALALGFFISRVKAFEDIDGCKKEYSDVSSAKKHHIAIIGIIQVVVLIACVIVNYYGIFSYDETYPNAEEYLVGNYEGNTNSLIIFRSTPSWFSKRLYISAQYLYEYEALLDDNGELSEDNDLVADELSVDMLQEFHDANIQGAFGAVLLLIFGLMYNYSVRCKQYHSSLHYLKEGKKK